MSTCQYHVWVWATVNGRFPARQSCGHCGAEQPDNGDTMSAPHCWTREQIEKVWDVFAAADLGYDRESMYYDEGADSEFCETHRQRLAETLNLAGLVPADAETP